MIISKYASSIMKAIDIADVIYDYLSGIDDVFLAPFLAAWPSKPFRTRTVSHRSLPVLSYLAQLSGDGNPGAEKIIKMLKNSAKHLSWGQTYSPEDFGANFLEKYGWTELIGLRGPIDSKNMACGFLLLGPDTEYPMHSHEADEAYIPLNSQALWVQGHDDWVYRPGGVPIYHRSWRPHGMRTESAPLIALYLWRGGDLAQKSHID